MGTLPAVGKTLAGKVHDGKVLVAIYNGHTTNWQNTIGKTLAGKILAGKVRFYVLEIVHCLLLRCPRSTLPTVCYHLVHCP